MDVRARSAVARRKSDIAADAFTPRRLDSESHDFEVDGALRHLVAYLDAVLWRADPQSLRFIFVTPSIEKLLGHPVSLWLGEPDLWSRLIEPEDRTRVMDCLRAAATHGQDGEVEFRLRAADGSLRWLQHVVRSVADGSGEPELWGVTTDITRDKLAQEALATSNARNRALSAQAERFRRQSLEDPLTGLPNRTLFADRLQTALHSAIRNEGICAVLLMDLDRFKEINDTCGHQTGDLVLREVALRLRLSLRRADSAGRLGGDEFAAVLPGADAEAAVRASRRILDGLDAGVEIDGKRLKIGMSIGIAIFPQDGREPAELLARADETMYRVKAAGGGCEVFDPSFIPPASRSRRSKRGHRAVRPKHWPLGAVLALATALALVSGVAVLVGRRAEPGSAAVTNLSRAAVALAGAPINRDLGAAMDGVEKTLAEMPLRDLATPDLVATLGRLHSTLVKLKTGVPALLRERVQQLLAAVQSAENAAKVGISAEATLPSIQQTLPIPPLDVPAPSAQLPEVVSSPNITATIPPAL